MATAEVTSPGAALVVESANKVFARGKAGDLQVLQDVSLTVAKGEVVTIVGPSGCGKSTLLTACAGLTKLTSGRILVNGKEVRRPGRERSVVFQHASLLPWRSVRGNLAYGMEMQRSASKAERKERVDWALELVGLENFADSYPNQLSGGMQQRVNLGRALATGPEILLMDEPFGALDAMTKTRLQLEVSKISSETNVTIMFVTHDIEEAVLLGDRVVVMSARPGRISKIFDVATPRPRGDDFAESEAFVRLRRDIRLCIYAPDDQRDPAGMGLVGSA
jgi:NitT/TauT family transport system ATP-binding protein